MASPVEEESQSNGISILKGESMGKKTYIIVKTRFEGFHYWKQAPMEVDFLQVVHRHIFYVSAKIPVMHNDRQLEFFIVQRFLQKAIKELFPDAVLGGVSCEMIAEQLAEKISKKFGIKRDISVSVFEDDENGAVVEI
jgi:hypothetical protein